MEVPDNRTKKGGTPVKPFSQLHANILFNIMNWLYEDIVIQPKSSANERDAALEMLKRLDPKRPYIVLMDRRYDGFNMIEHGNHLDDVPVLSSCLFISKRKAPDSDYI